MKASSLLDARPMEGVWYDRTAFGEARRRGQRVTLEDFAERELVTLSALPCWQGLSPQEIGERIAYLLESIERQHAERPRVEDKGVLGAKAVRRRLPGVHGCVPSGSRAPEARRSQARFPARKLPAGECHRFPPRASMMGSSSEALGTPSGRR